MFRRMLPAVAATVLTAGALALPSLAQDASDTPTESTTESSADAPDKAERAERAEAMKARHDELLAGELDITVERLQAAQESVRATLKAEARTELEARLAAKVEAGEITQERADEILARFDEGDGPGFGRRGGHGPRGEGGDRGPRGERPDDASGSDAEQTAA